MKKKNMCGRIVTLRAARPPPGIEKPPLGAPLDDFTNGRKVEKTQPRTPPVMNNYRSKKRPLLSENPRTSCAQSTGRQRA